jgi:Ca-activated chloride channel family protein
MDEEEAAMEKFLAAAEALPAQDDAERGSVREHRELRYRIHYNTGVIHFQRGDYAAAAGEFRRALETDGSHVEAKRNLELSLLSLDRSSRDRSSLSEGVNDANGKPDTSKILFDYMRQKEQDRWRSREWAEDDTPPGPDY